jgi:hypothetical protein
MDEITLRAAFAAHTEGQTKFTRRMAITIADMAGETPRGIVLRLERMRLLKPGSWEWFAENGGIKPEQIREVRAGSAAKER